MKRGLIDFWVGLFVMAGVAALLFLAFKVSSSSTLVASDTYTLSANFENIGGLKARAPIKSSGVVIGRVTGITFDPKTYMAKVSFAIDKRYQFSRDTSASILTSGLLGEQYIGLEPGADDRMLEDGGRITITSSAVVLEQLISRFLFSKAQEGGSSGASEPASNHALEK
ncbi:phospholipid/cholesterol/gamma-HCH transport system substrate-binding protein [Andreprevotia lacus DSM 23236]|jgi:phospholipid/cholesterol/gamma-HCH transport system substrate-binding protein|uniref:Phospholipid/cholesterol/gamma-HCH transport system substrate-binding protein n=1 Tax=Andreprevotia lacus DSM 23236 TaxID=1121001 RepID=A0A1W1XT20_9NEIS|nr:outer membrane lipid asymmetry maintenance protein MlaD [Andreprevotia lacus]SMC27103.1 phospholipid/cholesterol/gamma-HCH transport system substrate-binding protein [Andreprevotia lacus DSM 23236]